MERAVEDLRRSEDRREDKMDKGMERDERRCRGKANRCGGGMEREGGADI